MSYKAAQLSRYLTNFSNSLLTLNILRRDSSRFFHKFDLLYYSWYLSEIIPRNIKENRLKNKLIYS